MVKKLELTPRIRELIASATDGETDPEKVSVYESTSLNTLPVNKKYGLFEGAVHSEATLREMAALASARPLKTHIPVHVMHDTYTLPTGKVFHAELVTSQGLPELRSLFYLSNSEPQLVQKVEDGSVAEVSVGLSYKHINCNQCGFDYMADDTTMEQVWERTCANGHEIGVDGTHVILNGVDQWMEQSLVGKGAAQGAKIYGRAKSLLASSRYTQLSASGKDPRSLTLFASATQPTPKDDTMDLTQIIAELTTVKAENLGLKAQLTAATEQASKLPELQTKLAAVEAEIATLKAGDTVKVTAERDAALAVVREEADRLCVAAGVAKLGADSDVKALQASINENRTKLSATFSQHRTAQEDVSRPNPRAEAFRFSTTTK